MYHTTDRLRFGQRQRNDITECEYRRRLMSYEEKRNKTKEIDEID
jgi:hypothetical protein